MKQTLKPHFSVLLLSSFLFIYSCSGTRAVSDTEVAPENTASTLSERDFSSVNEATNDWYLSSSANGPYIGTGVERAYRELIRDRAPAEVIVAIIDSGTDIDHEDLRDNIWVNEDEIPGNGVDDDGNGYVDDIHGWNFIGGPDSTHVGKDTYELTRIYARLNKKYEGVPADSVADQEEYAYYQEIKGAFERRRSQNNQEVAQMTQIMTAISESKKILGVESIDSLSAQDLVPKAGDSRFKQQAKQIMKQIIDNGAKESDIEDTQAYLERIQGLQDYGLNPDFNPRDIVGDDYDDLSDRYYGNNDVIGPDPSHGTHVAGIVGAVRSNDLGLDGIADVKLMIIRTVPDGDERDKDVANAIRYAAENGARVINMSFGKGYSPRKFYVDEAVRFADSLGVLMVTGSGNDGKNIDSTDSYPSKYYENGGVAENYLNVGASSWDADSSLAASFSNYGKEKVDLFAPGVAIYSTYPDDTYKRENGTSMASPVVSGVAALLMSHFPELSTSQIKDILLSTVTIPDRITYMPGSDSTVAFPELSSTGGIVNAYRAFQEAKKINAE